MYHYIEIYAVLYFVKIPKAVACIVFHVASDSIENFVAIELCM